MMKEVRRYQKGRVLNMGESQRPNGKYRFKYTDKNGKEKNITSWRLVKSDPIPYGTKPGPCLRDMEIEIQKYLINGIAADGGNLTVLQLVEKYVELKIGVRPTTKAGYNTVTNI